MTQDVSKLFADWRILHKENEVFVEDGIIDPRRWEKIDCKVLFLLKEPGEDIRQHCGKDSMVVMFTQLWKGARYSFRSLGRWAYGLQHATNHGYPVYDLANKPSECNEAFLSSAFMNLKKVASKFEDNSCDENLLAVYSNEHQGMIRAQIGLINPDVVVCCGRSVFDIVSIHCQLYCQLNGSRRNLFAYKSTRFPRSIFLQACHPSSRSWQNNKGQVRRLVRDRYNDLLSEFQDYLNYGRGEPASSAD